MSWDRFHYIFRKSKFLLKTGISFEEADKVVNDEKGTGLYGSPIPKDTVGYELIEEVKKTENPEKAVNCYSQLNFTEALLQPLKLRRIIAYLTYLTIIYMGVSAIYSLKVAPEFVSFYQNAFAEVPASSVGYFKFWKYQFLMIFLLIGFSFLIGIMISSLIQFKSLISDSVLYKILIPGAIKKRYANIIEIMRYPLDGLTDSVSNKKGEISQHLFDIEKSGLNLIEEMQILLRREGKLLTLYSERYIQIVVVVLGILIITSIILFLSSAYAPIFTMGEMI